MPAVLSPLLNLQSVGTAQRAAIWARSASGLFPGLSVRNLGGAPTVGRISRMSLGPGRIWSVLSPPLTVHYDPSQSHDEDRHLFSIMMQLTGATYARQRRRSCLLRPGDCCAIDNGAAFELEVPAESSYLIFLQMPRFSVLGRHPYLERHTAELFNARDAGTAVLRGLLMSVLDSASTLEEFQRTAALSAIIEMLGVSKPLHSEGAQQMSWRVQAALRCIGTRFAEASLNAEQVAAAQGISRRRLDKLMVQCAGTTLTAQIWKRRLTQVADDLAEPRLANRSIAQIGFAAGFADPAHLTRSFRQTFACAPSEWRQRTARREPRCPEN